MKKVILDTDIGVDADDSIALAMTLDKHINHDISLDLISLSTTREGAASTVRAILQEYNVDVPICQTNKRLDCDKYNNYAKAIKDEYHFSDDSIDSISAWKNIYESSKEEIVPLCIGPLTNLYTFIKTYPELFYKRTKEVYLMMGNFVNNEPEFNAVQDLEATKYVINNIKCNVYILPFETGIKVLSGKALINNRDNAVGKCLKYFYNAVNIFKEEEMIRQSWDPLTVLSFYDNSLFDAQSGAVQISKEGITTFIRGEGNFYLLDVKDANRCSEEIEQYLFRYLQLIK